MDWSRAWAVNPTMNEGYYSLLKGVIEGEGGEDVIPPKLHFGANESGFQKGVGQKEHVFGPKGPACAEEWR